jgi:hypothetical protein
LGKLYKSPSSFDMFRYQMIGQTPVPKFTIDWVAAVQLTDGAFANRWIVGAGFHGVTVISGWVTLLPISQE